MTEESVDVGGARLVYHRRAPLAGGQAEPVILLHPWFGCWQFWRQTVEALPEPETFSVDLYSLGAGDDWQRFARPQGLAEALGALLEGLRIQRCSVVGNSMGGIAAQALAATRRGADPQARPGRHRRPHGRRQARVPPRTGRVDRRRNRSHLHRTPRRRPARATPGAGRVRSLRRDELLLEEGGFVYHSDAYNDDLPYYVDVKGTRHLDSTSTSPTR